MPCPMYLAPRPLRPSLWLSLWLLLLLAAACKQENPEVCCTTDADCQRLGGILPRGCPDGFVCRDLLCESADCAAATDCTAERPVCDAGTASCTGCAAAADCAGYADAPVCDTATGGCRACALDAECASEVCDVDSGRCVEAADVIYASANGADTAGCTHAQPCSVARALVIAGADPASSLVRLLPGTYTTQVSLSAGTTVLVGSGATLTGSYPLEARESAVVAARGFEIYGNVVSMSLSSLVPSLSLRDTTLRGTAFAVHGILRIRRSVVLASQYPIGVQDDGVFEADRARIQSFAGGTEIQALGRRMRVRITNSVLDRVVLGLSNLDEVPERSEFYLAFNTFVLPPGRSQSCENPSNYRRVALFENNIFVATSAQAERVITGDACTFAGNIMFPQQPALNGPNRVVNPRLVDVAGGDYRLAPDSPAIDAAMPSSGPDLEHDHVGAARPQGSGADIGAFERAP